MDEAWPLSFVFSDSSSSPFSDSFDEHTTTLDSSSSRSSGSCSSQTVDMSLQHADTWQPQPSDTNKLFHSATIGVDDYTLSQLDVAEAELPHMLPALSDGAADAGLVTSSTDSPMVVDIQDFCWVNEDYHVTVYIPFADAGALPPESITSSFSKDSFSFMITDFSRGVHHRLAIDSLYGEIQPDLCFHTVHHNKVTITLTKVTDGPSDGPGTNIFTWFSLRL